MSVRRSLAALSVVSVLFVAGCSEEPEPIFTTPTPTPTESTPTPAETPTVDPLAIPAAAKKPTKAGAEALVRHFYDTFNNFLITGDEAPHRRSFVRTCTYCEASVQVFGNGHAKGHIYEGSEVVVDADADLLGNVGGLESAVVFVTSDQSAIEEYDKGQLVSRIEPIPRNKHDFYLAYQRGQWKITNVELSK